MDDPDLMRRAIQLAMRGRGRVEPNPMVACIIVRSGKILAEGYHQYFGGPHAEANALASATDVSGSTAYVTLEPCCHTNKKTPPCTRALIASGISRVLAACEDPNPSVSGKGLAELRAAGLRAESGMLAAEARQLNAPYFKQLSHRRPYVTLKWAQTADGKIAGAGGQRMTISNETSLQTLHELRSRCDAILVGIGTVLSDDPLLTARVPDPPRNPVRIVLDSNLRISLQSRLIKTASQSPVILCCKSSARSDKFSGISGLTILPLGADAAGRLSLEHLLDELGARNMTHLLVDTGPTLARSFINGNLADRAWIIRSIKRADIPSAPAAAEIDYPATGNLTLDGDELTEYLNPQSPAFFALQKSADFRSIHAGTSTSC